MRSLIVLGLFMTLWCAQGKRYGRLSEDNEVADGKVTNDDEPHRNHHHRRNHHGHHKNSFFERLVRKTANDSGLSAESTNTVWKIMTENKPKRPQNHGQLSEAEREKYMTKLKASWQQTKRDARDEIDDSESKQLETFFNKMEAHFKQWETMMKTMRQNMQKHQHHNKHHEILVDFLVHFMKESGIKSEAQQKKLLLILRAHRPNHQTKHYSQMTAEERENFYQDIVKRFNAAKQDALKQFDASEHEHLVKFFNVVEEKYIKHIRTGQHDHHLIKWRLEQLMTSAGLSKASQAKVLEVFHSHKPNKTQIEQFLRLSRADRKEALKRFWNTIKADCHDKVDASEHQNLDKFFKLIEDKVREVMHRHHHHQTGHGLFEKDHKMHNDSDTDNNEHRRHHHHHHHHRRHHHHHHRHHDDEDDSSDRRHRHNDDDEDNEDGHRHRHHRRHHHDDDNDDDDMNRHRHHRRHHNDDDEDDNSNRHHRRHHGRHHHDEDEDDNSNRNHRRHNRRHDDE